MEMPHSLSEINTHLVYSIRKRERPIADAIYIGIKSPPCLAGTGSNEMNGTWGIEGVAPLQGALFVCDVDPGLRRPVGPWSAGATSDGPLGRAFATLILSSRLGLRPGLHLMARWAGPFDLDPLIETRLAAGATSDGPLGQAFAT